MKKPRVWAKHTRLEIERTITSGVKTCFLPFGSTEQHGPHLFTGNDHLFGERLAIDLASYFGGWVMPTLPYGMADHHMGFSGTITIPAQTLIELLTGIATSLEISGIENLVICNGHGGNYSLIKKFADSWSGKIKIFHDAADKLLFTVDRPFVGEFTSAEFGLHAGLFETSMAMYTHPGESVRTDVLEKGLMPKGNEWTEAEVIELIQTGFIKGTPNGVVGDPRKASVEKGEKYYNSLLHQYTQFYLGKGLTSNQ